MIYLEKEKCTFCGLCVEICHERCIELVKTDTGEMPLVDHSVCSGCTQCISVCPRQALFGGGIEPARFDRDQLPTTKQLEELLKERRTIRKFRKKAISQEILEKIAEIGKHAPTNHYNLRLIMIDDPAIMRLLDEVIMNDVRALNNLIFRSDLIFRVLAFLTPKVNLKQRQKIKYGVNQGTCMPTLPAVIVMVVGDRRVLLSEVSAHYALHTMILYAQSFGIGCRINASGLMNLDRSNKVRERLGLSSKENILAMVEMGFPAVRFSNKVEGRRLPIQWNAGDTNER